MTQPGPAQSQPAPMALATADSAGRVFNLPTGATLPPSQAAVAAARAAALLSAGSKLRKAPSTKAVQLVLVNEIRKLAAFPQAVILARTLARRRWKIVAISSVAAPDRTSPLVQWLEAVLQPDEGFAKPQRFEIGTQDAPDGDYPFDQVFMLPLCDAEGRCFAAVALLGDAQFPQEAEPAIQSLTETGAHAWRALAGKRLGTTFFLTRKRLLIAAATLAGALFIPVPMTVLAPAEIIARDAVVVAAPLQGTIEAVHVDPDQKVQKGDLLFSYQATDLLNRHAIALKTVQVRLSRLHTVEQEALGSAAAGRELAEARAELELAEAEAAYAAQSLALTKVFAPTDGVAVFSSRLEWTGKPVQIGERVMRVANPELRQLRIDMAVSDSILLKTGSEARIFLDADPLNPVRVTVTSRSYQAVQSPAGQMVYELIAQLGENEPKTVRIGLRGTVQLFGNKVTLGFFLFRKPLSAFRQHSGI